MPIRLSLIAKMLLAVAGGAVVALVLVTQFPLTARQLENEPTSKGEEGSITPASSPPIALVEGSYGIVTRAEMFAGAEAIVMGIVSDISIARWNQDSGEYWQTDSAAALPYHEITIEIKESFVDKIGLDKVVVVTVMSGSPSGSIMSGAYAIAPQADHALQVGDEALFFLQKNGLAWLNNSTQKTELRPTIGFLGIPLHSYLRPAADGSYYSDNADEPPLSREQVQASLAERQK